MSGAQDENIRGRGMMHGSGKKPRDGAAGARRGIATFLRLSTESERAARLLLNAGRVRPAGLLHADAAARLLDALLLSEGRQPKGGALPCDLPDANTMKPALVSLWRDAQRSSLPGRDGTPPVFWEQAALATALEALRDATEEAAHHFGVRPDDVEAARTDEPPRAEVPPPPEPPRPERGPRNATPGTASSPAGRRKRSRAPATPEAPASPPADVPQHGPAMRAPRGPVSSSVFWLLVDRWKLGDLEALDLLGHAGGLTKKGTRPRFRLQGAEVERLGDLRTVDEALATLGIAPADWLRRPVKATPFNGRTPAELMLGSKEGLRDAMHHILHQAFRRSLEPPAT